MSSSDFARYYYTEMLLDQYLHWARRNRIVKWLVRYFVRKLLDYGELQMSRGAVENSWSFPQIIYKEGLRAKETLLEKDIKEVEQNLTY